MLSSALCCSSSPKRVLSFISLKWTNNNNNNNVITKHTAGEKRTSTFRRQSQRRGTSQRLRRLEWTTNTRWPSWYVWNYFNYNVLNGRRGFFHKPAIRVLRTRYDGVGKRERLAKAAVSEDRASFSRIRNHFRDDGQDTVWTRETKTTTDYRTCAPTTSTKTVYAIDGS